MSVGITEGYDPSYDFRWASSKYDVNIIITKRLTDEVIGYLLPLKHNTILHLTCTGLTKLIEPGAFTVMEQCDQLNRLLAKGFPAKQVVLRVDPIVPTEKGIQTAIGVITYFAKESTLFSKEIVFGENTHNRVRFSFLDMYPHVKARFHTMGAPLPYNTFNAPNQLASAGFQSLIALADNLSLTLESCAEGIFGQFIPKEIHVGCVSPRDVKILKLDLVKVFEGQNYQRKSCLCCSKKIELIPVRQPCPNGCLYCFWKYPNEK